MNKTILEHLFVSVCGIAFLFLLNVIPLFFV